MSLPLFEPPDYAATFLGAPRALAAMRGAFAVIGIPFGVPYRMRHVHYGASDAPRAIRERSARFGRMVEHYDVDLGGTLFDGKPANLVDCGDVPADPRDLAGNAARATAAVRELLRQGAVPIALGGDDSISALALAAFEAQGPLTVLQIDAHIDYRDEVDGIRDGYSSPMRRAAEMPWVERIVHCGTRGVGSARPGDVSDTLARGNRIVTARELHQQGVASALEQFPRGGNYYIVLDVDGLDPSVAPGTSAPMPGGVSFDEAADLFQGLARRGRVVGFNVAEHYPALDINGITALAIARLIVNLIGATVRARSTRGSS
jgi:agmatinase